MHDGVSTSSLPVSNSCEGKLCDFGSMEPGRTHSRLNADIGEMEEAL